MDTAPTSWNYPCVLKNLQARLYVGEVYVCCVHMSMVVGRVLMTSLAL